MQQEHCVVWATEREGERGGWGDGRGVSHHANRNLISAGKLANL